ncbi:MAG: polysaccharide deacetylase family protein, partial [Microvirga sp.]
GRAAAAPPQPLPPVNLDGAARSVEIVEDARRTIAVRRRIADWALLDDAFRRARERGREPTLWWRDDDAVAETEGLRRLLALSRTCASPVALAVIPDQAEPSLPDALAASPDAAVLVHGFAHANHAPPGDKKAEFGPDRPLETLLDEASSGLERLRARFGERVLPVFVPPWNRIAADLVPLLAGSGYAGISTYGRRKAIHSAPGLVQVNTHIDPIDWHGSRSLIDPGRLIATAVEAMALDEPIGLLTHHLVHDEAVWWFCRAFLDRLQHNNIHVALAARLISVENRIVPEP